MKKPEETTIQNFLEVTTRRELAQILGVEYKILAFNLYKLTDNVKYIEFEIPKKNGGQRLITAPNSGIKYIQSNLSKLLLNVYQAKNCTHGYVKDKSIKTNAKTHLNKKTVINIDLENFFPSINFGRVRGIFKSYPFNFNDIVSTTLAQICCYKGSLPQGAPTSPIVSNLICYRLDNHLLDLAKKGKFVYTRYADDITFSTNVFPVPIEIGNIVENNLIISEELSSVIKANGFSINEKKTRYAHKNNRQEVTGLIVNGKKPNINRKYIRNVRAMLHACEKFKIDKAAKEHFSKYNYKFRNPLSPVLSFQSELVGKIGYIGFIRGKDDLIYKKLYNRIKAINPAVKLSIVQNVSELSEQPIVWGEGKTDWKHLQTAFEWLKTKNKFTELKLSFENYKDGLEINNTELLKICEGLSKTTFHKSKIICLFDRDVNSINKKVVEKGKLYKHWGNNVYSVLLPVPSHRTFENICIEHYYDDSELMVKDKNGRRLFLSTEFDKVTRKHNSEDLIYANKNVLQSTFPKILDSKVFNESGINIALPKSEYADNVMNKVKGFDNHTFDNFIPIFNLLMEVVKHNSTV